MQKEIPPFPQGCPFPVPAFLPELVEMMLDCDPVRRPPIRMLSQGFEDSFLFPREIQNPGVDDATIENDSGESALQIGQEWVRRERERIQKVNVSDKENNRLVLFLIRKIGWSEKRPCKG